MADFANVLTSLAQTKAPTRIGTVTSTAPFKVTFYADDDAVALPRLANYAPEVGDVVLVVGESAVVLGKVIPADVSQAQTVPTRSY